MQETLQEVVDSRGQSLRVDRHASVLRGVKLLGLKSKNGRRYRERALREAIGLYEGARVNVNHPEGDPLAPRDYRDRLGVVRNVEVRAGEGLFGELYFNPKHPLAEQLAWDAEHAPENVGLSHNVVAHTAQQGSNVFVESIVHVQSVDLVADPATTSGLYEHQVPPPTEGVRWESVTLEELQRRRPDLLDGMEAQHRATREALTLAQRKQKAYELLSEHHLPLPPASSPFFESLLAAGDDDALERLVAERAAALAEATRGAGQHAPRSREQQLAGGTRDAPAATTEQFVAAIKR